MPKRTKRENGGYLKDEPDRVSRKLGRDPLERMEFGDLC